MADLTAHCGKAYAGRVAVDKPAAPDNPFAGKALVMHISECGDGVLGIPFHVGEDRSRTWVLMRTATGMRLKHDHRHEDGSEDAITMYGGDTAVWVMEIEPGKRFVYELARPGTERLFRVEFDLTTPVPEPPPRW